MYGIAIVVFISMIILKYCNVFAKPEKSTFYSANFNFISQLLKYEPKLLEPYSPTRLWGYNGHIQTLIEGFTHFLPLPVLYGERFILTASDGATISYDLYQPHTNIKIENGITLAVAPGVFGSSKSSNIRRLIDYAQLNGYRVAVLNHVGVLKCLPVTSPRIFNYGNTSDYDDMVKDVLTKYPNSKIICIGYSMGGNIITKYLGERNSIPQIIAGIAACHLYDNHQTYLLLNTWKNFRKFYLSTLTNKYRALVHRWSDCLFSDEIRAKGINEKEVGDAHTILEFDDVYSRKLYGYNTIENMYKDWNSISYWHNISVPIVFINSTVDPLVPSELVEIGKQYVNYRHNKEMDYQFDSCKKDRLLIEQKYGGHLGFFEGGFLKPNTITWLDRTVISLANALNNYVQNNKNL